MSQTIARRALLLGACASPVAPASAAIKVFEVSWDRGGRVHMFRLTYAMPSWRFVSCAMRTERYR